MRYPLIIGNLKLNGNKDMIKNLIISLSNKLHKTEKCNIVIAPPMTYLSLVKNYLVNSHIILGAQNVDINLSGSFTGDISAEMLKDIGVKYVIIGHSERRYFHKEGNEYIAEKFSILKKVGLIPVLCIGENLEENKNGKTEEVCSHQIESVLNKLGIQAFENSVIAYEPIWAIGTGNSATPNQVQEVHKFIRNYLAHHSTLISEKIIIQYGGSVNSKNAFELLIKPDVDGVLLGGASLQVNTFEVIVRLLEQAKNLNFSK